MKNFKPIQLEIKNSNVLKCTFEEHTQESILKIIVKGNCNYGSQGENYGAYLYQNIGLALLTTQPIAVLIDLQELNYEYGDRIFNLFQVFDNVRPLGDTIITACVLSDKNKYGIASLLQLNLNHLNPPFFDDAKKASQYLWNAYDEI